MRNPPGTEKDQTAPYRAKTSAVLRTTWIWGTGWNQAEGNRKQTHQDQIWQTERWMRRNQGDSNFWWKRMNHNERIRSVKSSVQIDWNCVSITLDPNSQSPTPEGLIHIYSGQMPTRQIRNVRVDAMIWVSLNAGGLISIALIQVKRKSSKMRSDRSWQSSEETASAQGEKSSSKVAPSPSAENPMLANWSPVQLP